MKPFRIVLLVSLAFLVITPMAYAQVPRDFYVEVSKGNIPGHSIARMTGFNGEVGVNYEDLITVGGSYVFPTVAARVNVSSDDPDDRLGGDGAWNVTIQGLDADWNPISETLSMDGITNVTSTLSYIRINDLFTRRTGSSMSNEGTISAENNLYLSEILPDHGHSQFSVYSIPVNTTALAFSAFVTSSEDKTVEVELLNHVFGEGWHVEVELFSFRSNTVFNVKGFELIPGKSDIKFSAKVGATTGEVGATLNLLLIEDSVLHNSTLNWSNGDSGGVIISQPVQVNIVESIDLMTAEFVVFTMIAAILTYLGSTSPVPGDRMMRFGVAFLFWIATLSQWITDGGGIVPLLALTAPTLMSLVWAIQAMSEVTETPVKKDVYSLYN